MIYESLIVPSETPTHLTEIKRALLTYDKVKIVAPDDRDLIPANSLDAAIGASFGMPPLFGANWGHVRPIGKTPGYDDEFQKLLDDCKFGIRSGLIEVVSTYEMAETQGFTIGGIPTGGYPLDFTFVYWLYREMAQNQDFLDSAIAEHKSSLLSMRDERETVSLEGRGDGSVNDIPGLPVINDEGLTDEDKLFLTNVARSRLGGFIKYSGYCEAKGMVPLFPHKHYGRIATQLINNVHHVLKEVGEDKYWLHRSRILQLCHEEYLNEQLLDEIPIRNIVLYRTNAWGAQASAREELFESIRKISTEIVDSADFYASAVDYISKYKEIAEALESERRKLGFDVKCDIGSATLSVVAAGYAGLQTLLESPLPTVAATLAVGGAWFLKKAKEYAPALKEIRSKEKEFENGVGIGIHGFYSRIKSIKN